MNGEVACRCKNASSRTQWLQFSLLQLGWLVLCIVVAVNFVVITLGSPERRLRRAIQLYDAGTYGDAMRAFQAVHREGRDSELGATVDAYLEACRIRHTSVDDFDAALDLTGHLMIGRPRELRARLAIGIVKSIAKDVSVNCTQNQSRLARERCAGLLWKAVYFGNEAASQLPGPISFDGESRSAMALQHRLDRDAAIGIALPKIRVAIALGDLELAEAHRHQLIARFPELSVEVSENGVEVSGN